jgi:hypothetical protein
MLCVVTRLKVIAKCQKGIQHIDDFKAHFGIKKFQLLQFPMWNSKVLKLLQPKSLLARENSNIS